MAQSPSTTAEITQMCSVLYYEAVGSLMYTALRTQSDITFAVQTTSHFLTKPRPVYWKAVMRIFQYLKGTIELWLSYRLSKMNLTGYINADESMAEDWHAISEYAFLIHSGAIFWSAKWQKIITLSMTEAEYIAITHASKEALWLCSLFMQLFNLDLNTTTLFLNNKSAIKLIRGHQYHVQTILYCQKWLNLACLLSYQWYDHQHTYKSPFLCKGKTFCISTWTLSSLRRSVGIQ